MRVRPRIAAGRGYGQPAAIMLPALFMAGALFFVGQPAMGETHQRARAFLEEVDLDQARFGRHFLAPHPAEAVGEAMDRDHFREPAACGISAADADQIDAAWVSFRSRIGAKPTLDLVGIGEEGEHRGLWGRDLDLGAKHLSHWRVSFGLRCYPSLTI